MEGRRLASPRLAAVVRHGTSDLFQLYTASLAAALNRQLRAPHTTEKGKDRCGSRIGLGGLGWLVVAVPAASASRLPFAAATPKQ